MQRDLSLAAFERALGFRRGDAPALVQLGVPEPDELVLWCAPEYDAAALQVELEPSTDMPRDGVDVNQHSNPTSARVTLKGLSPDTEYSFALRVNGRYFARRARTAPSAETAAPFSFLAFSCLAPFKKQEQERVTPPLLAELQAAATRASAPPSFGIGMGDQVYVDDGAFPFPADKSLLRVWPAPSVRYDDEAAKFFEVLYRSHFGYPGFGEALSAMPAALMWDDHEICDGWGSHGDETARLADPKFRAHVEAARRWFVGYQALRNPLRDGLPSSGGVNPDGGTLGPELHYRFDWGALATFFVMDLRSQRTRTQAVSEQQLAAIRQWLASPSRPEGRLFVLVTPIPLTLPVWPRWDPSRWSPSRADDAGDQWWADGVRRQGTALRRLLGAHFRTHPRDRLLVLSGDVHYSEARQIVLPEHGPIGHEVVSSGLAQSSFYEYLSPVRTLEDRFPSFLDDEMTSTSLGRYHGASFAELAVSAAPRDGAPRVTVRFYDGKGGNKRGGLTSATAWELLHPRAAV